MKVSVRAITHSPHNVVQPNSRQLSPLADTTGYRSTWSLSVPVVVNVIDYLTTRWYRDRWLSHTSSAPLGLRRPKKLKVLEP